MKWWNSKVYVFITPSVIHVWKHRNSRIIRDSVLRSCDCFMYIFFNHLNLSTQCNHRAKSTSMAPGETNHQVQEETIVPSLAWVGAYVQLHSQSCCPWLHGVLEKRSRCWRGTKRKIRDVENVLYLWKTEVSAHIANTTEGLKDLKKISKNSHENKI